MLELEDLKEELQEVKDALNELESRSYCISQGTSFTNDLKEYHRLEGKKMLLEELIGRTKIRGKYSL